MADTVFHMVAVHMVVLHTIVHTFHDLQIRTQSHTDPSLHMDDNTMAKTVANIHKVWVLHRVVLRFLRKDIFHKV